MATRSRTTKRSDPDALKRVFAGRLAELRREKSYTVEEFAERFDAKTNTVRDWLNARVLPRADALHAIALHFGVTTDWLLGTPGAPKYWAQRRSDHDLHTDLAAAVERELHSALPPSVPLATSRIRDGTYRWRVDGAAFYRAMIAGIAHDAGRVLREENRRVALKRLTDAERDALVPDRDYDSTLYARNVGLRLLRHRPTRGEPGFQDYTRTDGTAPTAAQIAASVASLRAAVTPGLPTKTTTMRKKR